MNERRLQRHRRELPVDHAARRHRRSEGGPARDGGQARVDWVHDHQLHRLLTQDDRDLARDLGITGWA